MHPRNAKDTLQMKYNRGRQAAITNELVDILLLVSLKSFDVVVLFISRIYPFNPILRYYCC